MNTEAAAPSQRHPLSELDRPVFNAVTTQMKAELVVNERNEAWLLYDAPLRETVKWIEYDLDANKVCLVFMSGRQQDLGIDIAEPIAVSLQHARTISLMQVNGRDIQDYGSVPFFTRGALNFKPRN